MRNNIILYCSKTEDNPIFTYPTFFFFLSIDVRDCTEFDFRVFESYLCCVSVFSVAGVPIVQLIFHQGVF